MITMETLGKTRRMHLRNRLSLHEVSKRTGLSRNTRSWRGREGNAPRAFVPLSFEEGEAFQFDWSEEGLVVEASGCGASLAQYSGFNARPKSGCATSPPPHF